MKRALLVCAALTALLVASVAAGSGRSDAVALVRIASDPFGSAVPGAHSTVVEPSAIAVGSTIVSAFQVGRNFGGGAAAIGFATSTDRGASWRSGLVPRLTTWTPDPGTHSRASDPVVAYDAFRGRYLVAGLLTGGDLTVSASPDGVSWGAPVTATSGYVDKEWLTCDGWSSSRFRGRCYLAYTRFDPPGVNVRIDVQASADGGQSWTAPAVIPIDNSVIRFEDTVSAEPVVRPDGELVVIFFEGPRIRAARSGDGGASFGPHEAVAELAWRTYSFAPERLRAPNIPSVAVDAAGTVYAVWSDCRFRESCRANDIVLARSLVPGVWSQPQRIPLEPLTGTKDFVLPAVAVQPETHSAGAHLSLAYYSLSTPDCSGENCELTAGLATSLDAGQTWRTTAVGSPMRLDWLAPTVYGRMVGDYVAAVFVPGRAVGIYSLAGPKQGESFDQAAYAASAPLPLPPRNTQRPRVVGQARVARTLTCRRGSWNGTPPLAFRYRWLRGGRPIRRATSVRYRLTRREAGALVACRVQATNAAGSAEATAKAVRMRARRP
jgi:hypothetical protein